MLSFPNAKINIGLNITKKRADGFHNIESCFYPIGWSDALEIRQSEKTTFQSSGIAIPGEPSSNLCVKAYDLLSAEYKLPPVDIHLLKSVPIGAGLGGGSSDAAFTIKVLNELFNLHISLEKQLGFARQLGSDCAFFIENKAMYCYHKGDEFEQLDLNLATKWIVLVNPGVHISTQEAYAGIQPRPSETDLRLALKAPVSEWKYQIKNDFEATLFPKYPLLPEIKEHLYTHGAMYASMSGSGSTVYGIFDKEVDLISEFAGYKVWQGSMT